jgi:hypothetical protein
MSGWAGSSWPSAPRRFRSARPTHQAAELHTTEAIDTTTPGGRLVFHLFGALGQFERDLIQERTRAGLAAAAALEAIVDLDLASLTECEPPRGYGRD